MTRVYGHSDDTVEIIGSDYPETEIPCFDSDVRICFTDGTIIRLYYGKGDKAIWQCIVEQEGDQPHFTVICDDEDARIYSDIFQTEAEVLWHEVQ